MQVSQRMYNSSNQKVFASIILHMRRLWRRPVLDRLLQVNYLPKLQSHVFEVSNYKGTTERARAKRMQASGRSKEKRLRIPSVTCLYLQTMSCDLTTKTGNDSDGV